MEYFCIFWLIGAYNITTKFKTDIFLPRVTQQPSYRCRVLLLSPRSPSPDPFSNLEQLTLLRPRSRSAANMWELAKKSGALIWAPNSRALYVEDTQKKDPHFIEMAKCCDAGRVEISWFFSFREDKYAMEKLQYHCGSASRPESLPASQITSPV